MSNHTETQTVKTDIRQIDVSEYKKCNNIWNMKNCPFTQQFKTELISGNRETFVLEINNELIAEASFVYNHKEAQYTIPKKRIYLSRLIVKKEYRNRGIGSTMIDYMIKKATAMGYDEISIGVDCDNTCAIHVYKKAGFKIFEESADEYGKYYKMLLQIQNKKKK